MQDIDPASPGVSALVCTRNRPDSVARTVHSLLASPEPFELIVVDQSANGDTREALSRFVTDGRLRYVPSTVVGKGAALNLGLFLASHPIVVCTDDDCEAPPGWVIGMGQALEAHPRAAIMFCNVLAPPHDRTTGYIPAYERTTDRTLTSVLQVRQGLGLGAGMAIRREAVLHFGGFDESFGPGSRFPSGDDWDISLRALLKGWHVCDTAAQAVRHFGFRTYAEGRAHARRDWVAIGALFAKPLRAGYFQVAIPALYRFVVSAAWPPIAETLRGRRPSGWSRISGFLTGFTAGLLMAVDSRTIAYAPARFADDARPASRPG